jgi:hypothetical protein
LLVPAPMFNPVILNVPEMPALIGQSLFAQVIGAVPQTEPGGGRRFCGNRVRVRSALKQGAGDRVTRPSLAPREWLSLPGIATWRTQSLRLGATERPEDTAAGWLENLKRFRPQAPSTRFQIRR